MRIKHPDTFTCDICGADMTNERKVTIPVLKDLWAYEWGTKPLDEPRTECADLDLCDECLRMVTVIRERPVFYGASKYEFIDKKERPL